MNNICKHCGETDGRIQSCTCDDKLCDECRKRPFHEGENCAAWSNAMAEAERLGFKWPREWSVETFAEKLAEIETTRKGYLTGAELARRKREGEVITEEFVPAADVGAEAA